MQHSLSLPPTATRRIMQLDSPHRGAFGAASNSDTLEDKTFLEEASEMVGS